MAISLLTGFVHSHVVYKSAKDFVFAKDTGYIESCNSVALIYLDKRILYDNQMYETRQCLWILDWNEHVDRPFTSRDSRMNVAHERQNLGKKRHVRKQFTFVEQIWDLWTAVCRALDVTLCT